MNEINFPQFSWITKPSKNQRKEEKHQQKKFHCPTISELSSPSHFPLK